jgi:hypothetical protein
MSLVCFLLDEHVPPFIQAQLAQMAPDLRVHTINDDSAPVRGTLDPEILIWIETHGCMLVTNNRASMPGHLADHLARGHHIPGIVQLPRHMNIGAILDDLWLIGAAAQPGEFQDQIVHLPLRR